MKLISAIRGLRFEKPLANIRNSAELKDDYSAEDDAYIMSIRYDLLDLYRNLTPNNSISGEASDSSSHFDAEKALRSMKRLDLEDLLAAYNF